MSTQDPRPNYLKPGTVVGAYRVEEQIGGGGFGFVYQVTRDGKAYALKIGHYRLSALGAGERTETLERLDREVAALMSLRHPNIVRVHTFERWPDLEGFPYIVMDYVAGKPLQEWREDARPSLSRIVAVFEKVADALQHMHQLGIIHRDLKSDNVVVRGDGEPFIVDFGVARPLVARELTQAATVGTLSHLAPEYATYLDSVDAKKGSAFEWRPTTDLYALGYVLYEALACEPPVPRFAERTAKTESELLNAVKNVVPKRPREIEPRIPEVLDELAMQLVEKDPRKRPQTGAEVARRIREAREAGEAQKISVWVQPLDVPGSSPDAGVAGAERREPAPAGEEELPPLEAADEANVAGPSPERPQPAAVATRGWARQAKQVPEAAANASPEVALPTAAQATGFIEGAEEAARTEGRKGPVEHSRVTAIIRRAAVEFAPPRSRRWVFAGAGAAAALLLVLVAIAATRGPPSQPAPRNLLAATEPGAGLSPPALAHAPATELSPPLAGIPEPSKSPAGRGQELATPTRNAGRRARPGGEAGVTDEAVVRKSERPTTGPDGRVVEKPFAEVKDPSGLLRSRPLGADGSGLLRSVALDRGEAAPKTPVARGVAFGSHIQARLLTNLDTRTIGNGPVEAVLQAPFVVRGKVILPTRTMVYGTAAESGGRFTIRFTRMRLPDDTELDFEGIALARADGKPGLAASGRIGQEPKRGEGLGTRVAKGTGNLLLDTVAGGIGQDIVRSAGQTALNHEDAQPVSSDWALLLDAGVVFDVFVEKAF